MQYAESIKLLSEELQGYLQLVGYFYNDYPGFSLEKEVVAGPGCLGLGMDSDSYYLYSHERENS